MDYSFGDVVPVAFPFTNLAGQKKRPAVVVSSASYNTMRPDLVILAITSQIRQPVSFGEALLADWQAAGLIKASVLKPVYASVEQSIVVRRLGALSASDQTTLRQTMAQTLG